FRAIVGAGVLGGLARALSRGRLGEHRRNQVTVLAVLVGLIIAKLWRGVGIDYFQGLLAWLQEGSTVALFGGLKGLSTRLTMLVALLGASLAAATGTHINIDVVVRFIPKSLRKTVAIASAVATATVCLLASYGFLDFIAVTAFKADTNVSMTAKVSKVSDGLGEQFFVWRKQLILDIDALPHVLAGGRYDDAERMNGRQWNAFVDAEGFAARYGAEKVAELKAPASDLDAPRIAFVTIPDGSPRGILVRGMDLVFPFGFLMIALRVLLRAALVAGGAASTALHGEPNPDESEDELASNESTAEAPS
ncbi:MAG: TRAP transporter small permease subunit, partial [Polyangiaceae bacterium]